MNILEQIFRLENPKLKYKISEEVYDLLFDWFNESQINISAFEKDFFEPLIKTLGYENKYIERHFEKVRRGYYLKFAFMYLIGQYPKDELFIKTLERESNHFESNFESARRESYLKFAFMYLIGHYPKNELLKRFFDVKFHIYDFHQNITKRHLNAPLTHQNSDLFRPLNIGVQVANYYHAIHAKIDQNIGYLPGDFAQLKFHDDDKFFNAVFDYVNSQTFEEKPYLMFLLYKSTKLKRNYEIDGNGKHIDKGTEVISVSPYDKQIEIAFENSIKEYNQLYNANLNKASFLILKDFLSFNKIDKKAKLTIDNFEEAKLLIHKAKGIESLILDHIIYYIQYESLYEQDRYWEVLLTAISDRYLCPADWLEAKIDFLLSKDEAHSSVLKNEIRNAHLIFKYIVTPLLQKISATLNYTTPIVQKYESLLYKRTITSPYQRDLEIIPYQKGIEILKTIASQTIANEQERNFVLSKYSLYYFTGALSEYSSLTYDENDKNFKTIKDFVDDLNILTPVALKKVIKQNYYNYDEKISFIINHDGRDITVSSNNFIKDINGFLEKINSSYKLVAIPLYLKEADTNGRQPTLFSMAFMSKKEHTYFYNYYLTLNNLKKWFKNEQINWINDNKSRFEILNPSFNSDADISFAELKISQQNNDKNTVNSNVFLTDINWEWFKIKYIDALSSKEHWYEIMNIICQSPKGKKPTSLWLSDLRKEIEKLGTEKYFKELQVLFSLSIKEESWFFDIYANALKGLIWSCAYIEPNDLSLSILKTITEHSFIKIHGIGAKSTITGNLALEALVATQKEEAFGILNIMRNKTKYNKFVVALEKSIDKFKENSTIPEQLLADKSIPSFGFEHGVKTFEIADHQLIVGFQKKNLVKSFIDNNGNSIKKLPTQISDDHAKLLKEINEEIKQISSIFNDLSKRIKTYWLYNRSWRFVEWNEYLMGHALIYPHIETLIWTNKTQNKDFIVIDNQLLDIDNNQITPNPEDEICLWHPVVNNDDNIGKWQNYLWVNNIIQSQRQVYRENYPFSESELDMLETPRFAHHFLEVQKLMALANNAGWIFTYVHEGVNWPRLYLKPLNISVHLVCDYDRYSFAVPTKQIYFTNGNSTKINDYFSKQSFEKIKLLDIPTVTLSEICRDIDLFIATTSIAHNVELSENRQEYESYRTEYEKGLFSDNANAKIRKQIIERITPVLKLKVEKFEGNFVIIKGKSDTYKINLNSGFAQSNDTQKHLNLIPNIKKLKSDKKLRLPIEDDETLYIILAKIMHLQTI